MFYVNVIFFILISVLDGPAAPPARCVCVCVCVGGGGVESAPYPSVFAYQTKVCVRWLPVRQPAKTSFIYTL